MLSKMKDARLPTEKAFEPSEDAYQPLGKRVHVECLHNDEATADDYSFHLTPLSGSLKEVLSQPAPELTHRQKMLWIQKRRKTGLWVQCDDCDKWRFMPDILDQNELPKKWRCKMNPDTNMANCDVPEKSLKIRDEENLIYSKYSAGSVVWARMKGYPWWPAMVDDCPDVEQFYWTDGFSDIPTHYHVVFFDASAVTRAWISTNDLIPYDSNKKLNPKFKKYWNRLKVAINKANDSKTLTLANRLTKYSFISLYTGYIATPKKLNKRELKKYQNQLKRKLNIEFSFDSGSETEEDVANAPINNHNIEGNVTKPPKKTN